jgi:Tfp pilus assembly protein PilF
VRLHETLAMEMMDRGDLKGARTVAEDGTRVAPNYWNIWFLLGKVAEEQGDLPAADLYYRKALSIQAVVALQNRIKDLEVQMKREGVGG